MAKLKDGFYKLTAEAVGSNSYMLLAGGGSKALSDFVTDLGTNGNYITWTKNSIVNNLTVPYATNADKIDGKDESDLFVSQRGLANVDYIDLTSYTSGNANYKLYDSGIYTVPRLGCSDAYIVFKSTGSTSAVELMTSYRDTDRLKLRKTVDNNRVSGPWRELAFTSDIPTKVSQLTNDSGYLTSTNLTNYVTLNGNLIITGAKTFTFGYGSTFSLNNSDASLTIDVNTTGGWTRGLKWANSAVENYGHSLLGTYGSYTDILYMYMGFDGETVTSNPSFRFYKGGKLTHKTLDVQESAHTNLVTNLNAEMVGGYNSSVLFTCESGYGVDVNAPHRNKESGALLYKISSNCTNIPSGCTDGVLVHFNSQGTDTAFQLASNYSNTGLYYRSGNLNESSQAYLYNRAWKKLAFTDSNITGNAASATKLETPRTIWGLSFDGTKNVQGALSGATTITTTGNITTGNSTTTSNLSHTVENNNGKIGIYTATRRGLYDYTIGNWLIGTDGTNTRLMIGNVGIGTDSPTQKLDVNGNVRIYSTNLNEFIIHRHSTTSGAYVTYKNDSGTLGILGLSNDTKEIYLYKGDNESTPYIIYHTGNLDKSTLGLGNVQNTAFYKRYLNINGNDYAFASTTNSSTSTTIYGPTTAGTSNYILKSNGSGAPTWIDQSSITAGVANRLKNLGKHSEVASSTTVPSDLFEGAYYNSGMFMTSNMSDGTTPGSFGNIINVLGNGGSLLLLGWEGSYKTGNIYYRSHRDIVNSGGWTPWRLLAFIDSLVDTANTANKLTTARTINVKVGGTSGTAQSFDGSSNITIPVSGMGEAYLTWGGKNISGSISPIDAAMSNLHSANRLAFSKPDGITIEYSRDGSTWVDYGASDLGKINLVSGIGGSYVVGARSTGNTINDKLRVTLHATNMGVYTQPRKLLLNIGTSYASNCTVTLEYATKGNQTSFSTQGTYAINGWTGWNSIPITFGYTFGGSSDLKSNVEIIRLTFSIGGVTTGSDGIIRGGLYLARIILLGDTYWSTPSTMAKTGHLYSYDYLGNATFPAKVTATKFIGNLNHTLTFSTGKFAANTYNNSAAVTVNVPTHTSHLTNDSGFLTAHLSLANYVTLNSALTITGLKTFESNSSTTGVSLILKNKGWRGNMSTAMDFYNGSNYNVPNARIETKMVGDGTSGGTLIFYTQTKHASTNPNPNGLTERMRIDDNDTIIFESNLHTKKLITLTDNNSYIKSSSGNVIVGAGTSSGFTGGFESTSIIVGNSYIPTIIRTSANDLYHYRGDTSTRYSILDTGNSSVTGGGSNWGSSITINLGGTSKTLTIPSKPSYSWTDISNKPVYSWSGSSPLDIILANYGTMATNLFISAYLSHGSGSIAMGYKISGYESTPYGGWFGATYSSPWFIGASAGTWSLLNIITDTNYTSYTVKKDGTGASGTWGINITGNAGSVKGSYTANGGQQNPNYFGVNKVGFLMMNTTVNNNSSYKDWIIMDCYAGSDVGGAVAFGINRQSLGAYIMRSASERTSWTESAELLGTHNYSNYALPLSGGTLTGDVTISKESARYIVNNSSGTYKGFFGLSGNDTLGIWSATLSEWLITLYSNNIILANLKKCNVGIRNSVPTCALDVTGAIKASEGITVSGTSDFSSGTIKFDTINIPTTSGGSTYGPGANGQVLKSNGSTVYWANDNNSYGYIGTTSVQSSSKAQSLTGIINITASGNIIATSFIGKLNGSLIGGAKGNIIYQSATNTTAFLANPSTNGYVLKFNTSTGLPYWASDNNTTYTLPLAASGTRGGILIGYSENGKNYAVKLSSEKAYVYVPWTDTKVTLTNTTTNANYRVLLSNSANDNNTTEKARKSVHLTFNPQLLTLYTGNVEISGEIRTTTSGIHPKFRMWHDTTNDSLYILSGVNDGSSTSGTIHLSGINATDLSNLYLDAINTYVKGAMWVYGGLVSVNNNLIRLLPLSDANYIISTNANYNQPVKLIVCANDVLNIPEILLNTDNLYISGSVTASGEITAYSDRRLKSNIKPLENRGYIQPMTYIKDNKECIGFIAQDVLEKYPELVNDDSEYLSLNYLQYVAVLQALIIELEKRVKELENGTRKL